MKNLLYALATIFNLVCAAYLAKMTVRLILEDLTPTDTPENPDIESYAIVDLFILK